MRTKSPSLFSLQLLLLLTAIIGLLLPATGVAGGGLLLKGNTDQTKVIPDEGPVEAQLYTEGNLVVKLISPDSIDIGVINSQFGTTVDRYLGNLHLYLLNLPPGGNPDTLAAAIGALGWVDYAHPNYMTDPLNPVQGSYPFPDLQHVGDYDNQAASSSLQLSSVHQVATGSGVVVGVLDGGVDYAHPELTGNVTSGWDYVDEDADAMDEPGGDNSGHGTFVAGVIGLIAPDAMIRSYRVADVDGTSDGYVLAEAIMQAVDDGCDVINLSLAMLLPHSAVADAIAYARSRDVLVVAAAGNGSEAVVRYPAADANALAVAAVDSLNHLAEFSNYGDGVDVCAPGAWIYSPYQDDEYAWWDGTSFASPFVAGQAALLRSHNPSLSVTQLVNAIKYTAEDIDSDNPGYIDMLGTGFINPLAAVNAIDSTDSAWVMPDTLRFTALYGSGGTLQGSAYLMSANAPAAFTGQVQFDTTQFVGLIDTVGFTNDSVRVNVFPSPLPSPGVYRNTVSYSVDGVLGPVDLVVELTLTNDTVLTDSAWVEPSAINRTVTEGATTPLWACVQVQSTNAPATFFASSGLFATVPDSIGLTGDSACIRINPAGLTAGSYCDTILFDVTGVAQPAWAAVCLTVTPGSPDSGDFYVAPDTLYMTVQSGAVGPITEFVTVGSELGNLPFTVDSGLVAAPYVDTGTTPTSFAVRIYPERAGVATLYIDELVFWSDSGGFTDTLVVWLEIQKRPYTNPHSLEFTAEVGTEPVFTGCVTVHNDGEARPFTGSVLGGGLFTTLIDSTGISAAGLYGVTDSVCLQVDPTGLAVGTYVDTVTYTLDSVLLPAVLPVTLTITPPDTGGGDYAWATPSSFSFSAPQGSADTIWSCVTINSTNAPANYFAESLNPWQAPQLWLLDSVGVTGDSLCFQVNGVGLAPGVYCDTISVSVDGISGLLAIPVCYEITGDTTGGGGTDSAWTIPSTMNVTAVEGSQPVYRCVTVHATNHPATYFGYATNWMFVGDSIRTTGDTSCFYITINGRSPGTYVDTGYFYVDGISQPALTVVNLNILPDSSGGGGDSVLVFPDTVSFMMPQGYDTAFSCFTVWSSNSPAAFTVSQITFPPATIFTYIDSGGVTPDSACVSVSPFGRGPGLYCETLAISVDGIAQPASVTVCLTVTSDTLGGDSITVYPDPLNFTMTEGSGEATQYIGVFSSNLPASYTIGQINMPPATIFTYIDSGGVTPDSARISVSPNGRGPGTYCEQLAFAVDGISEPYILDVCLTVVPDSLGGDTSGTIGTAVALEGNYPNPFNPETNISFSLPNAMDVELTVYNVLGQHIKTLVDRPMAAGEHVAVWDGRGESGQSVASGIYFYRLTTEETVATRKMLLLK